jgi:hypothetical protein
MVLYEMDREVYEKEHRRKRSSTKDLSLPIFELVLQPRLDSTFYVSPSAVTMVWSWTLLKEPPIRTHDNIWESYTSSLSSMDSGRVAGPNPPHFAPIRNCSLLDTYTKCYTRIAPWLTLNACAGHGSLRAQHFSASPRHGLLRARHLALRAVPGLLRAWHLPPSCCTRIAPCSALAAPFHAQIAPRSSLRVSPRPRIASCSTLGLRSRGRIAPSSQLSALCCPPIARCSALSASRRSRITSCSTLGLPSRARMPPCSRLPALC